MICASVYLFVFIQNLLMHLAEKILLMQPLTFGGDYLTTWLGWNANSRAAAAALGAKRQMTDWYSRSE